MLQTLKTQFSSWKGKLLSKASRVTLSMSVLTFIPIYSKKDLWLPERVCNKVDKLVDSFIWDNRGNGKGLHLVKWEKVTTLKILGGLGI